MSVIAKAFLDGLRAKGFVIGAEGVTLKVTPASRLTAQQRAGIGRMKQDLLRVLWDEADTGAGVPAAAGFRGLDARAEGPLAGGGDGGDEEAVPESPFGRPERGTVLREDCAAGGEAALNGCGGFIPLGRPLPGGAEFTAEEDAEWRFLVDWFATAELPTEPYSLGPHLRVEDPATSHAVLRRDIAAGPRGQLRRALHARLAALYGRFGKRVVECQRCRVSWHVDARRPGKCGACGEGLR